MNKTNIQPSFLLKNINVTDLYKKYKQGYFNRPIQQKTHITFLKKNKVEVVEQLQLTPYKTTQLSGEQYVVLYKQNKKINGGRCQHCLTDFTTEVIGYPVAYEEKQLLVNQQYQLKHLFWIEGCFHSNECCLAYIDKTIINNKNPEFDIKVMFNYMLKLLDVTSSKANDTQLLNRCGGSMNDEDWTTLKYERTNEVIKIPAQIIYQKI
jgi:hypothetical protein